MGMDAPRSWAARIFLAVVLITTLFGASRSASAYTVRTQHPRIWLTPDVLARVRAQAAVNDTRWLSLKTACDVFPDPSWDIGVMDYALAYQVSGNTVYADKAIALMQAWVNAGIDAISADSGYPVRAVLPGMAIGYDWCYDRLTPAQRTQFRAQMEAWADWVWPETNPSRATGWAVNNAGDNYFHGFMMTWMIGLALAGESSKATGYIDAAINRWNLMVLPYLNQYAAGGYLMEGTSYGSGSLFRMFWYLSAHRSATGEDLMNAPGVTWPRQAMLCRLHQTAPTRDRQYPGGEQARSSAATLSDYDRSSALLALTQLDGTTSSHAKWWLDHITPNRDEWLFTQWEELLWYRDDIAGVDYTQTLPLAYYAPGAGWMTSRSSWATDAVQVSMICGPSRESHQDRAQNGFVIYFGAWLAALARLNSHDGLFEDAQFNNSITVGGYDQSGNQQSARVVHFGDASRYSYFAGDAPDVFNLRVTGSNGQPVDLSLISEFRRELLFIRPNRIVVFDRINGRDPSLVKRWHLNTLTQPLLGPDTYQVTVGNSTLFGKTLLPLNPTLTRTPLNLGINGAQSSWRIDLAAPTGQNVDHFLNVMEAVPSSQTTPTPVASIQTTRATLFASQIGDQVVVFDDVTPAPASVVYLTSATPAREHFILDLEPSRWYQVLETTLGGTLIQEQAVQATDQGSANFITAGTGARRITLNQLAGPPANNQLPVAQPGGPYSGNVGQIVTFNGTASTDPDGSLVSHQWNFGDGTTGSGATTTHAYAAAGTYTVTLTVTDNRGATTTASTTVSVVVPPPPPTLIEDFNDNTRDQTKWTLGNIQGGWDNLIPVLEQNQRLEISPRPDQNGAHYSGYVSTGTWDLTNAGASVEVVQVAGGPTTDTEMTVILDASNLYQIAYEAGKLYFQVAAGGAQSATSINYSATAHRFWRIRHEPVANTILFETSPDRVTWTTQRTVARQINISALKLELSAGTWQYLGAPGTAIFDNFRFESNTAGPANQAPVPNAGGPYAGTPGQSLSFNGGGSTDPDGTIASFQWNFGDGGSATGATTTHAYVANGTYTVTLSVTDNRGATATTTTTATITAVPNQLPVANAGGPYNGTTGLGVAFNGGNSSDPDGTVTGYQWSFGDGTTGSGVTPTHAYAAPGSYTATLTVTDNRGGTASASSTVSIVPPPSTMLSDDFTDNARDGSKWTLGAIQGTYDALTPILEQNQRLEIAPRAGQAGDHYGGYISAATWDLTNAAASVEVVQVANGATTDTEMALCLDAANFFLMVHESGRLYFQAIVAGARSSTSIAYSATQHRYWRIRHDPATNAMLFETSADRGTWTTQRSVLRQIPITALRVELSAGTWQYLGAPGTAIFDTFRIDPNGGTPNQNPVANPGGPYSGTTGQPVAFNGGGSSDPDGTIASYQWSFGDSTSGTGATPTHTYAAAGTYTVTLTVTDNRGATASSTTTATIALPPNQLPVANAGGPYAGTTNQAVSFNGAGSSDPDGTITTFQWNFGDSTSGTGATTSHTYTTAGTYTVTLTVTDNRGGTNSASATVTVNLPPNQNPTANSGGPYTGTTGVAVAFNGGVSSDPDGSIVNYQWNFGDGGTATGSTPTHAYATVGTYTVSLTVTDNRGGTNTATTTATISLPPNQLPLANPGGPYSGTTGLALSFNGTGSSDPDGTIASYQWSFGDTTTGTGATPFHTYGTPGTYIVTLTVIDNRGGATSAGTTVTIAPPPPVGAFIDDFNDNIRDSAKWSLGVIQGAIFSGAAAWDTAMPVLEQNQRLEIAPRANQPGDRYNGYVSSATWDLTDANASVEVVQIANGPTTDTALVVGLNPQNFYMMETESGRLYFQQIINGARSSTSILYNAVQHRFWRIRHNPATNAILFETSPDRTAWTPQRSVTRQLAITAVKVELTAGTWQPLATPGVAIFDNFRLEGN